MSGIQERLCPLPSSQLSSSPTIPMNDFAGRLVIHILVIGFWILLMSNLLAVFDFCLLHLVLIFAITKWWSLQMSAPRCTRMSCRHGILQPDPSAQWSICVNILWSFENHVILCTSLCSKSVDPIIKLFIAQNCTKRLPFSVLFPNACGPMTCSKPDPSPPIWTFMSPITMVMSWCGILSTRSCSCS